MKPARIFLKFRIVACVFVSLISVGNALSQSLLNYVDTRVGSAYAETKTAGKFGKGSEEHGQTVPAFKSITLDAGGKLLNIRRKGADGGVCTKVTYDGKPLNDFRLSHNLLINGGTLLFE